MLRKNDDKEDCFMHTKTMEGLVGAGRNMDLMNTPMRVYREAERKGDTETMERAMGYANECSDRAEEYKKKADEGMKKDAEETRRIAKKQREEAIQKRRDEREEMEKRLEESRNADAGADTAGTGACLVEISGEGKALLKEHTDPDSAGPDEGKADTAKKPVAYTKTGEAIPAEQEASISVSV